MPYPRHLMLTRRQLLRGLARIGGVGGVHALSAFGLLGRGALAVGNGTTAPLPAGSMNGKKVVVIGAGIAGLRSAAAPGAGWGRGEHPGGLCARRRPQPDLAPWRQFPGVGLGHAVDDEIRAVGDMPPNDPDNYLNAGPGRIPQHHARVIDYCKLLGVELQPYIYIDKANLMQNDAWNGGRPVQVRRLKNDLRGIWRNCWPRCRTRARWTSWSARPTSRRFSGMLSQFGQLTGDGAQMVYAGLRYNDCPRAGYRIEPGDVTQPGRAWPTLSLEEVLESNFWNSEMFHDLEYFWQSSSMQPVDGMDMIWKGFLRAQIPARAAGATVEHLVAYGQPVREINVSADKVTVTTGGPNAGSVDADYVIATLSAPLLALLGGNFLNPTLKQVLSSVYISPACKVGLQGRSRFWEEEDRIYGGISWTKDIITQIWYPSFGFNNPTGVLTGAYNQTEVASEFGKLSRAERLEAALLGGEKLHPGYRSKVFADNGVSIAWARMPYQAGGWANDTAFTQPDVFQNMANADPIGRKVFMAGDWFSYWPGWQVGALDSAHLATERIAALVATAVLR